MADANTVNAGFDFWKLVQPIFTILGAFAGAAMWVHRGQQANKEAITTVNDEAKTQLNDLKLSHNAELIALREKHSEDLSDTRKGLYAKIGTVRDDNQKTTERVALLEQAQDHLTKQIDHMSASIGKLEESVTDIKMTVNTNHVNIMSALNNIVDKIISDKDKSK